MLGSLAKKLTTALALPESIKKGFKAGLDKKPKLLGAFTPSKRELPKSFKMKASRKAAGTAAGTAPGISALGAFKTEKAIGRSTNKAEKIFPKGTGLGKVKPSEKYKQNAGVSKYIKQEKIDRGFSSSNKPMGLDKVEKDFKRKPSKETIEKSKKRLQRVEHEGQKIPNLTWGNYGAKKGG